MTVQEIIYFFILKAKDLVNPECKTLFKSRLDRKKESLYLSSKEKPLGQSRDNSDYMPSTIDRLQTSFGKPTEFCELHVILDRLNAFGHD